MSHPRQHLGRRVRRSAHVGRRRALEPVGGGPTIPRRTARGCPSAHVAVGAVYQLVQALCPGIVGTDRCGVGCRQPHLRFPPRRARRGAPGRMPDSRGRRQPVRGAGGHLRGGIVGCRARSRARHPLRGKRLQRHRRAARFRRLWWKPSRSSSRRRSPAMHSATTSITISSTPPARNGPERTRWSPTGSCAGTSSASDRPGCPRSSGRVVSAG